MPAEANFSELLQKPKDTVARLLRSMRKGLRLHRRDGEDLYLTTAERIAAWKSTAEVCADTAESPGGTSG